MSQPFPHDLLLDLMKTVQTKDKVKAYGLLYDAIEGQHREFLLSFMKSPELHSLPEHMLSHYLEREEYEKCTVLSKFINEI